MRRHVLFRSRILLFAVAGLCAFVGSMLATRPSRAGRFDPYHKLGIFTKVLSYIENNYV